MKMIFSSSSDHSGVEELSLQIQRKHIIIDRLMRLSPGSSSSSTLFLWLSRARSMFLGEKERKKKKI